MARTRETADIVDIVWPIGSVYLALNNVNPNDIDGNGNRLGGNNASWVKLASGSFVVSAGTDFPVGSRGGSDKISLNSLPRHRHNMDHGHAAEAESAGSHNHSGNTNSTGSHTHSGRANLAGNHNHDVNFQEKDISGETDNTVLDAGTGVTRPTTTEGAHTHTLDINSAGSHSHGLVINNNGNHKHDVDVDDYDGDTGYVGNSEKHLPPYLAVFMWQRVS